MTGQHVWVAGTVGPLGKPLSPLGPISHSQARGAFREQIEALAEAGVDLLMLETFTGLSEIEEAIAAANSVSDIPIVALLTFTQEGTTPAGETPTEVATTLSSLKVASIGANCSVGSAPMLQVLEEMVPHATVPLTAMPKCRLPYICRRPVRLHLIAHVHGPAWRWIVTDWSYSRWRMLWHHT